MLRQQFFRFCSRTPNRVIPSLALAWRIASEEKFPSRKLSSHQQPEVKVSMTNWVTRDIKILTYWAKFNPQEASTSGHILGNNLVLAPYKPLFQAWNWLGKKPTKLDLGIDFGLFNVDSSTMRPTISLYAGRGLLGKLPSVGIQPETSLYPAVITRWTHELINISTKILMDNYFHDFL